MATATKADQLKQRFADAFGCKPKFVFTRLNALGHHETCTRCGGSGEYSYCQSHGTRCFKCGGSGKQAFRLTVRLLKQVEQQIADGEMEPYLERMRLRAEAKRAGKRFSEAWNANPITAAERTIHFTKCSEIGHAVNFICAPLHDLVNREWAQMLDDGSVHVKFDATNQEHVAAREANPNYRSHNKVKLTLDDATKDRIALAIVEATKRAATVQERLEAAGVETRTDEAFEVVKNAVLDFAEFNVPMRHVER
jgi:hypothetical protein